MAPFKAKCEYTVTQGLTIEQTVSVRERPKIRRPTRNPLLQRLVPLMMLSTEMDCVGVCRLSMSSKCWTSWRQPSQIYFHIFYPLSGVCLVSASLYPHPSSGGHNTINTCLIHWNPVQYVPQNSKAGHSSYYRLQSQVQTFWPTTTTSHKHGQRYEPNFAPTDSSEEKQPKEVRNFELDSSEFCMVLNCI